MKLRLWSLAGIRLASIALAGVALVGCSKDSTGPNVGTVRVHLTDAPAAYEQVNIVVTQVSVHRGEAVVESDTTSSEGWEVISTANQTFDLLTLRNGVTASLAEGSVLSGHYSQIRLKIGAGSNVVVDGVTHPLVVPSGMQSGLKLVGNFDVPAGGVVDLTLDFDAQRSIVLTGNGTYMLKPVIRVIVGTPSTSTGAIRGHLLPEGTAADVFAIAADTVQSTAAGSDGRFTLSLLPAGSYQVAIHPAAAYRDTSLANIAVTNGNTTDVGDVQLTAK